MRLLIIGAGGQGQVIADAVLFTAAAGKNIKVIGYLDDDRELHGKIFLGAPVLGSVDRFLRVEHDSIIMGIGSNTKRKEVYERLLSLGATFRAIVHPRALVAHDAAIGPSTYIGAFVIIAAGTIVGHNCIIHGNSVIGHHNLIGDHVHIAPGVNTAGHVSIGSGAMIGISATIMPQRSVGAWTIVGSASLVHRDVADNTTVVGVPAKPLLK